MKKIIDETYGKAQNMYEDFIGKFVSGKDESIWKGYGQNVKDDQTEFINFCNMFSLKSKKVVTLKQTRFEGQFYPEYLRCFVDKWCDTYNLIAQVTLKKICCRKKIRVHILYIKFLLK